MRKFISTALALSVATLLTGCNKDDSGSSSSTFTELNSKVAGLDSELNQSQSTIQTQAQQLQEQTQTIAQITQMQKDATAASLVADAQAKATLDDIRNKIAASENPEVLSGLQERLDDLQKQFDADPKFDPATLLAVQAGLSDLQKQFDDM